MYYRSNDTRERTLSPILQTLPRASAVIRGNAQHRQINGTVRFYQAPRGVLVVADIAGLPNSDTACEKNVFAFHIHSGESCTGNGDDPFANAGTHYNPHGCLHPYHAGDMPPLFATGGQALLAFSTDRFEIGEILGKTVIIHDGVDDFTSQPAGNAGNKIACGVITAVNSRGRGQR